MSGSGPTSASTELYPAIDLLDGACVRLAQGDYTRKTVYSSDPVEVIEQFIDAGALWVHIVDLNAARGEGPQNRQLISTLTARAHRSSVRVETGGGVRSAADAAALFDAGVARVVVGTAAVRQPQVIDEIAALQAGDVAVGLDAHLSEAGLWQVAVQGWTESTGLSLFDVLARSLDSGASAVIATDISRDGMLTGPAIQLYVDLISFAAQSVLPSVAIIASGGISGPDDVSALAQLGGLAGVIAGRAIYEGLLDVAQGVELCRSGSKTR
jgi:phosphoribosylformimino-5-aminoimidazole carboxamide ribotide isomerase